MKILLDCDGVLANFTRSALLAIKRLGLGSYSDEDITQYKILNALGFPKSIHGLVLAEWCKPGFCTAIEPYAEAKEHIEALRSLGEIVVVTAPMPGSRQWAWERKLWLKHHFDLTSVISTEEKQHVQGDVIVDDKPSHLINCLCPAQILFQRPWNESDSRFSEHYYKVRTWPELIETIKMIKSNKVAA